MFKWHSYILLFGIVLLSVSDMSGQGTMPDKVWTGQVRRYYVIPNPGSTYMWWIDGVIQNGSSTNEFVHTWARSKTYLLEVQERSAYGCLGPLRSIDVIVTGAEQPDLVIPEAFSPNGDLINDSWNIGNIESYPNAEITIYNRWGQSVWRSETGYTRPWDGKSKGTDLPIDSYHYVIDLHNGSKPIIGEITIVR
jgi:gliding motility-associated-like protein